MSQTKIYLDLSDEFKQLLSDNETEIKDILLQENIDADVTYGVIPQEVEEGARSKDLVAIILASSAAVISISFAISKILNTLYNKPHLLGIYEYEELRDDKGNALLSREGKPRLKMVKRYELIEPRREQRRTDMKFSFGITSGIVIKFSSEEKEVDETNNR